jgi:hypothetical protein
MLRGIDPPQINSPQNGSQRHSAQRLAESMRLSAIWQQKNARRIDYRNNVRLSRIFVYSPSPDLFFEWGFLWPPLCLVPAPDRNLKLNLRPLRNQKSRLLFPRKSRNTAAIRTS